MKWDGKTHGRCSENFAINVRFVLALQQVGCCGTEAQMIMSFLNLPNATSMKKGVFHRIKNRIGEIVREITEQECHRALEEEVFWS